MSKMTTVSIDVYICDTDKVLSKEKITGFY